MKVVLLVVVSVLFASCKSAQKAPDPVTPASQPSPTAPASAEKSPQSAQRDQSAVAAELKCKSGEDERVLSKVVRSPGCELTYTKFGKTDTAAVSAVGETHCDNIMARIRKNLETAGFTCE